MIDKIVLDTNIWIDKLIFNEPKVYNIFSDIAANKIHLCACKHMYNELERVLDYPIFNKYNINKEAALQTFSDMVLYLDLIAPKQLLNCQYKCNDRDDQIFFDFCITYNIKYLISKDKQVLKLKSRLHKIGVCILLPEQYQLL
jgi:uncharacterized protein